MENRGLSPVYAPGLRLGSTPRAGKQLFRYELEPGLVDQIRRATNGNFALGNERFAADLATTLGRRSLPGKSGRPRKLAAPESGMLFEG